MTTARHPIILPPAPRPLPPAALFSLGREIRVARRDVAFARTDIDRARTMRRLEALRLTAWEHRAGVMA